jgi:hypothetical protein
VVFDDGGGGGTSVAFGADGGGGGEELGGGGGGDDVEQYPVPSEYTAFTWTLESAHVMQSSAAVGIL